MGISASRTHAINTAWDVWHAFCWDLNQDPFLQDLDDPIPLLQIFARRYREGLLAPSGASVRSQTVEGALHAVGQTLAALGQPDPRLQPSGKLELRLHRQLKAYSKQDPPPHRVKPIPLPVITHAAQLCHLAATPLATTIADMLVLGFFFLLRPGEYAFTNNPDACPFRLCDLHLLRGSTRLSPYFATDAELDSATHIALEFTNQKNGTRGELVGHSRSGDPRWCPVQAAINRIKHFRLHRARLDIPLYSYFHHGTWTAVPSTVLTAHLRSAAMALGAVSGISASDISARSLRPSGAMALLCAAVDTDIIRLLGRWKSD